MPSLIYSAFIGAYVLPAERATLRELAKRDDQSVSAKIRDMIAREATRVLTEKPTSGESVETNLSQ